MSAEFLSELTVAEFKQFKVAIRTLLNCGIGRNEAINLILDGIIRRRQNADNNRVRRDVDRRSFAS